jgi:chromate transporter
MSHKLLKYFLKLGATGFGGPLALIQQMRKDLVQSEQLIEADHFDQAFTLIKAMPGPVAFQMAVHCGHKLNGFRGAVVSAFGLIFPAFLMMIVIGVYYSQMVNVVYIKVFFQGMQYAVAAVILFGLKNFILNYKKNILFWFVSVCSAFLFFTKIIPESLLIIGFGLVVVGFNFFKKNKKLNLAGIVYPLFIFIDFEKIKIIFKTCFMAGALVFGTGLAVFPFLQSQFVDQLSWLPLTVFNDGVTFGQMTPGPVTISTTFLGYQMASFQGAFAATAGLLLPPFFHMTTWFPRAMKWMSAQKWISHFILGSTAAVVGCLVITVYKMNASEIQNLFFWYIFCMSAVILYFKPQVSIFKILFFSGLLNLILSSIS